MNNPYLQLIRFHQPAGTLLLVWPPLWCLVLLSDNGWPPPDMVLAFILGAFFMRSAGCVMNDITDRKLDAQVERTKTRPLAAGTLTLKQAYSILALLLAGAFCVALYLGQAVLLASLWALPLVAAYPWMKRITYWPQLFLGITFNYGVLLASIAMTGVIHQDVWWLYAACVFWTLGYDTIYGFQDIEDDEKIGVKSTARLFKGRSKLLVGTVYGLSVLCLLLSGLWPLAIIAAAHFAWQVKRLEIESAERCRQLFKSNGIYLSPLMLVGAVWFTSL